MKLECFFMIKIAQIHACFSFYLFLKIHGLLFRDVSCYTTSSGFDVELDSALKLFLGLKERSSALVNEAKN